MLKLSAKKQARLDKFKKIGAALSHRKNTDDRDYHTGKESSFHIHRGDNGNRETHRVEIPYGPEFKTPQWGRTVKND